MASNSFTESENIASRGGSERPASIDDALDILNRAAHETQQKAASSSLSASSHAISERASNVASVGVRRGREIYSDIDARVRANPWPFVGTVTVGTFALGFYLARSRVTRERM